MRTRNWQTELAAVGVVTLVLMLTAGSTTTALAGESQPAGGEKKTIMVKGSDTMVHVVSTWAEAYMKKRPDIEISVTGGGSGTGISALINKTTDICMASRAMKDAEIKQATDAWGVAPKEFIVGLDGISVIVNPAIRINEMTMAELKNVFTGTAAKWSDLGGPKRDIIVLSRENSSGTFMFFQEHVLKKADYSPKARFMTSNSAIIQAVSEDKWAIGYVGLGYAVEAKDKIKMIAVKADEKTKAVSPSEQTVKDGTYPISRPLYIYVPGKMTTAVQNFIDFMVSKEGQKILVDAGYVSKN